MGSITLGYVPPFTSSEFFSTLWLYMYLVHTWCLNCKLHKYTILYYKRKNIDDECNCGQMNYTTNLWKLKNNQLILLQGRNYAFAKFHSTYFFEFLHNTTTRLPSFIFFVLEAKHCSFYAKTFSTVYDDFLNPTKWSLCYTHHNIAMIS